MSKDCDIFSDTYGCVFTDCEGYQTPFPILRLGDPTSSEDGASELTAIADCRSVPRSHKLLMLNVDRGNPCRSFLEILSHHTRPLALHHRSGTSSSSGSEGGTGARFFGRLSQGARVTAVVSRGDTAGGEWSAIFVVAGEPARQCTVPGVHAVAMVNDNLAWCLHGTGNRVATVDPDDLLQLKSTVQTASVEVPAPLTSGRGSLAATGEHTAAIFHSNGIYGVDLREGSRCCKGTWSLQLPSSTILFPGGSCGVAAEHLLVCCTVEGELLFYDQRRASVDSSSLAVPLLHKSLGVPVGVRSWLRRKEVLLTAADQVGVLDTRTMTAVGALQQTSDGDVLDATLLSSCGDGQPLHICTSALNGMLYHWRMSY